MDNPNLADAQLTLETPPPVITKPVPTVISGIDRLTVNPDAIGASPDPIGAPQGETQQPVQQPQQPVEPKGLTIEERIKADQELQKFIEAERSRAVTGARQRWDTEVLAKKLEADAKQREEALQELSRRAISGDEDALKEIGKNTAAQVMHQLTEQATLQAYANQLFSETESGLKQLFGDDTAQQLHMRNFKSIPEWMEAVATAKANQAKAEFETLKTQELEKLSEAKALDLYNSRRQLLPNPDPTQPVSLGGGGTPRKWKTLSEAAALFSNDDISANEYSLARQWYEENRIPFGEFGE